MRVQDIFSERIPSGVGSLLIVHLDRLADNARAVRNKIGDRFFWAVVKADAYGLGSIECSRVFLQHGADGLAVARLEEYFQLRASGFDCPILILGPLPDQLPADRNLHVTVSTQQELQATMDGDVQVHIKIDTGMGRLGFLWDDLPWLTTAVDLGDRWCGLWSHYSHADQIDHPVSSCQQERMRAVLDQVRKTAPLPPQCHLANSGGLLMLQEWETAVRPGLFLYGVSPWQQSVDALVPRPVLDWVTRLRVPRQLESGWGISYNAEYTTNQPVAVAVAPVGYADGLPARCRAGIDFVVDRQTAISRGRVTMDLTVVELSEPLQAEQMAWLLGPLDAASPLTIESLAKATGRVPYECLTAIGPRVIRHYVTEATP